MPCPDRLDCAFLVLVCRLLDGYARSFGSLAETTALGNLRRRPFLSALGRTLSPVGQRLGSMTAAEWNSATSNMKAAAGADEPLAGRRWKPYSCPATDCTRSRTSLSGASGRKPPTMNIAVGGLEVFDDTRTRSEAAPVPATAVR